MKPSQYLFEGVHLAELENDAAAFEKAAGWHDDRDAEIEKLIGDVWCRFVAEPFALVAGWQTPDGAVLATDENEDPISISAQQYITVMVNHLEHLRMRFLFNKVPSQEAPEVLQDLHTILAAIKKID